MAFGGSIKAAAAYVELSLRKTTFQRQWNAFQGDLRRLTSGLSKIGAGAVSIGLNTKAFFNGLKAATSAFSAAVARMRSAGRAIVFGGIVSALPFTAALAELTKFDDKMRTVRAVSEASEKDFIQLTESAKRFAAETRFSAEAVADLMIELGRAGFVADEIDAMTLSILKLARATGTDTTTAAVAAATAMRQFSLPVTDITRVVDAFTVASNASFASVESLTESFQYAGPILAQLGYSIEESLAIIGTLANFGIKGSEAGTAVRRIATISVATAKEIEQILGASFVNSEGKARKLYEVLNEIQILTKGLGNAARAAKFEEAFGILGITSATVISEQGDTVLLMLDKLEHKTGTTDRAFELMDAGIGGSFGRMVSKAKLVAIQLADTLTGAIVSTEKILHENFDRLTKFIDKHKAIIPNIAEVIAGFTAIGIAVFGFGVLLSPIAAAMTILGTAFSALATLVGAVTSAVGLLVAAFGPAGLAAAIAAAGLAIAALYKSFNTLKGAAIHVYEAWKATFGGLAGLAQNAVKGIRDAISGGDLDLAFQIIATNAELLFTNLTQRMKIQLLEVLDSIATASEALNFKDDSKVQAERQRLLDRERDELSEGFRAPHETKGSLAARAILRQELAGQAAEINTNPKAIRAWQIAVDFAHQRVALEDELARSTESAAKKELKRAEFELAYIRKALERDNYDTLNKEQLTKRFAEAGTRVIAAAKAAAKEPILTPEQQAAQQAAQPSFKNRREELEYRVGMLNARAANIAEVAASGKVTEAKEQEYEQQVRETEQRARAVKIEEEQEETRRKLIFQAVEAAKAELKASQEALATAQVAADAATKPIKQAAETTASTIERAGDTLSTATEGIASALAPIEESTGKLSPKLLRKLAAANARLDAEQAVRAKVDPEEVTKKAEAKKLLEANQKVIDAHNALAEAEKRLADDIASRIAKPQARMEVDPIASAAYAAQRKKAAAEIKPEEQRAAFEKTVDAFGRKGDLQFDIDARNAALRQAISEANNPDRRRLNPNIPSQADILRRGGEIYQKQKALEDKVAAVQDFIDQGHSRGEEHPEYFLMTAEEIKKAKKQAADDARRLNNNGGDQLQEQRKLNRALQNIGAV